MSRVCSICGKSRMAGNTISHSHRKATRCWNSNVQKVKYRTAKGTIVSDYVCTRCMRSGKIDRV